jgi:hypothetical protein
MMGPMCFDCLIFYNQMALSYVFKEIQTLTRCQTDFKCTHMKSVHKSIGPMMFSSKKAKYEKLLLVLSENHFEVLIICLI